jgi:hypothetical protein
VHERLAAAREVVLSRCGRWVVAAGSGLLKAWFEIVVDAVRADRRLAAGPRKDCDHRAGQEEV